jgi:dihydroorotate dehydrogenase electron transfer subunit
MLAAPAIGAITAPGQFVMVKAAVPADSLLRRPFSVFEILREGDRVTAISIFNKRAGRNTRALYALEPGARVRCLGPLGTPFSTSPEGEAWLVAGGVGLAPFATLAESLRGRHVGCTLFYGARRADELFCLDFFRDLGVELILTAEDGSLGEPARVLAPLDRHLAARAGNRLVMVYACGPAGMLAATASTAARHGRPCQVSVERIMGFKRGSGGTAGVSYLRKMLEVQLFPELWNIRTQL